MKKRIILTCVHLLFFALALIRVYIIIKGPEYYTYMYQIDNAINVGFFSTSQCAALCTAILGVIEMGGALFYIIYIIKNLWTKQPIKAAAKGILFWCGMVLVSIVTCWIYLHTYTFTA